MSVYWAQASVQRQPQIQSVIQIAPGILVLLNLIFSKLQSPKLKYHTEYQQQSRTNICLHAYCHNYCQATNTPKYTVQLHLVVSKQQPAMPTKQKILADIDLHFCNDGNFACNIHYLGFGCLCWGCLTKANIWELRAAAINRSLAISTDNSVAKRVGKKRANLVDKVHKKGGGGGGMSMARCR